MAAAEPEAEAGAGCWWSHLKVAGGVVGGLALVSAAPLAGGLGLVAGAAVVAGQRGLSENSAFDAQLDEFLRSSDAAGSRFKQIQRFSKRIDRLYSDFGCGLAPMEDPALQGDLACGQRLPPKRNKQELPLLRHSGIVLQLAQPHGSHFWIAMEFAREGLKHEVLDREFHIQRSYLIERCRLNDVRPTVVADCLRSSQHRTYNALMWNCNHVSDMVYEAALASSSDSLSGDSSLSSSSSGSSAALDQRLCKICFDAPRDTLFTPCGHFCSCAACADRVGTCPLCSATIDTRQRVYDG